MIFKDIIGLVGAIAVLLGIEWLIWLILSEWQKGLSK